MFVNGISKGKKSKGEEDLHLQWSVIFEPGTIKAVGTNPDGKSEEVVINTAGKPSKLRLTADRTIVLADNQDLSFITVEVLDKDNNLVPDADNLVEFTVTDLVSIAGVDNGKQTSHESFKANFRKAYNGKCLLIVKSKRKKGNGLIVASSNGLTSAELKINVE